MLPALPPAWRPRLEEELRKPYFLSIAAHLESEQAAGRVILPPPERIFAALELTPPERVRVVILGQDPYPTPGDAHGLSFSVPHGRPVPRSLRNIYKELAADIPGFRPPAHGNLECWARQGVLLLNTVLTVAAGEPFSHRLRGWETFTDRIVQSINDRTERVVFLLWGNAARKKRALISESRHAVVACAHPSPLSARKFFGSRCFSAVNRHLVEAGLEPIDWQVPDSA